MPWWEALRSSPTPYGTSPSAQHGLPCHTEGARSGCVPTPPFRYTSKMADVLIEARYLIDRLATQVWELADGRMHVFGGTYAELLAARERALERSKQQAAQERAATRSSYATGKQERSEDRKRARAVADAESRVHALEAQLAQLEQELHDAGGAQDVSSIERLGQRYVQTQRELDAAMETWMNLAEAMSA